MKIAPYQIDGYIQKIAQEKIAGCLVFGPELSAVNYRFDAIAKKISPDLSDPFLVANLSKERLAEEAGLLADEFFSYPMLGGRKLILVKDCESASAAALKLLFQDPDFSQKSDNFILVQAGDLDKSSALRKVAESNPYFATIACYEDNESVIKKFIASELVGRGVKFNHQVVDLLSKKFGKNRQIILLEMEKILAFLGEDKNLSHDLVEELSSSESEISVNEFVMSFAARKFDVALLQSEKLFRDGVESITLIRFLANYLQKLYFAKASIESNSADFDSAVKAQQLFFKTEIEFRKHLKDLPMSFLVKKLHALERLEIEIKSGIIAPKLSVTNLLQGCL